MQLQEYLKSVFQVGWISPEKETFGRETLRTIGVRTLERHGRITGRDLAPFTNGITDLIHLLRTEGYIKPKAYDVWEVGKSGKRYKVYQWSGKTMNESKKK